MPKDRFIINFKEPQKFVFGIWEKEEESHDSEDKATLKLFIKRKDIPEPEKKYREDFLGKVSNKHTDEYDSYLKKNKELVEIEVYREELHCFYRGQFALDKDIYIIEEPENKITAKIMNLSFMLAKDREIKRLETEIEALKTQLNTTINDLPKLSNGTFAEAIKIQAQEEMITDEHIKTIANPNKALPQTNEDNFLSNDNGGNQ